MKHIACWVVLLSACTDFESIARDVCGNGLIERGEDCDSSAPSCVSCSLTCTVETALTDCPSADYQCGGDGFCHAPGGVLDTGEPVGAFEVNDFRISDVDHDSIGDALGVSRSSIVVRYGDAAAPLSRLESTVTPPQTGPAAFGDLDLDGSTDLSITTLDGLVSYTSRYDRISGLEVVSTLDGPANFPLEIVELYSIGPLTIGALVNYNGVALLQIVDFNAPDLDIGGAPCGRNIPIAEISADSVEVYPIHRPGDLGTNAVISIAHGTGAQKTLCVLSVYKALNGQIPTVTNVTPTNIGVPRTPILADMTADGDRCPSILNSVGGMIRKWDGVTQGGQCTYNTAANNVAFPGTVQPTAAIVGRVPLEPQTPFFAPDTIVFATGVFTYFPGDPGSWGELYRSTRLITDVGHGDFDDDDDIDGALIGAGDDIEILWRANPLLPVFEGFLIDTASQPANMVLDDFDGNGRVDVAYTEPSGERERLMIAYGTADQPLPPIEVARFAGVGSLARVKLGSSSDYLALTADLVVLFAGMPSKLSLLSGSTQRTMLSFFDPRTDSLNKDESVQDTTIFRGTVIGKFTTAGGEDYPDVVALAALRPGLTSSDALGRVGMRAWSIRGTDTGLDGTRSDGVELTNVTDCSVGGGVGVCVDDAKYIAWPLSETRDVVIAIDRDQEGAVFDPANIMSNKLTATTFSLSPPAKTVVRSLRAADLDGDGIKDLIATFGPAGQPTSAVLFCQVDAAGIPNNCRDLFADIRAAAPGTTACFDAAPGRFGFRGPSTAPVPGTDLIVLCRDIGTTIHRISIDAAGTHVTPLTRWPGTLSSLEIGDVTGDGVDDIVAIEGEAGARTMVVIPQCTSRDTACMEGGQ